MKENDWKDRISVDPRVCHGRPCIKGTRIWVSLVLDFMAGGSSQEEILAEYPQLQKEDLQACIAYGAETARERKTKMNNQHRSAICEAGRNFVMVITEQCGARFQFR